MEKRAKNLLKNTTILGLGTFFTKVISFLLVPIITRIISTNEYGFFDLSYTYITLLVPILTLGIGEGIFRFLIDAKSDNEKKKIISSSLMFLIISILIPICFILLNNIFRIIDSYTFLLIVVFLILEIIFDTLGKVLRGNEQINNYTISNILFFLGILIGILVFLFYFKMKINGVFLAYIFGDLMSITFMVIKSHLYKIFSFKSFEKKLLKSILKYSLPLIINGISWWIISVSDRTVTSIFCGLSLTGIYAIANKIPSLIQTFYNVFHISWLENASKTIKDEDSGEYYNYVFNKMYNMLVSITVMLFSSNFIFFNFIFSKNYYSASLHSPILVLATFFMMLGNYFGGIYVAKKDTKKQGQTVFMSAIINLLTDLLLIKFIGLFAASISTLIAYFFLYIVRKKDINKTIEIKLSSENRLLNILVLYFFVSCYFNIKILNFANLLLSMILFLKFNSKLVIKILKRHEKI